MTLKIADSWKNILQEEFQKPYFNALSNFVKSEYRDHICYPHENDIFSAFNFCAFDDVKVVIIGQDPYHDENQANGKELYGIYCAVCHGNKGDGQGILMTREKFLGVPSYADREITPGSIYHVLMYGKNAMGSHAGQVNAEERWQIAQHVMELRSKLVK